MKKKDSFVMEEMKREARKQGKKLPEETSGAAEDAAGEEAAAAETPSADENAE